MMDIVLQKMISSVVRKGVLNMLDYTKITFNELDNTDKPLHAFYNYDLKESEIDSFFGRVRNY